MMRRMHYRTAAQDAKDALHVCCTRCEGCVIGQLRRVERMLYKTSTHDEKDVF